MLNPIERARIYRQTRAILVAHWIDLGHLDIHVGDMFVTISGRLKRLGQVNEPLTGLGIEELLHELRHISGAPMLRVDFENWKDLGEGTWQPVGEVEKKRKMFDGALSQLPELRKNSNDDAR